GGGADEGDGPPEHLAPGVRRGGDRDRRTAASDRHVDQVGRRGAGAVAGGRGNAVRGEAQRRGDRGAGAEDAVAVGPPAERRGDVAVLRVGGRRGEPDRRAGADPRAVRGRGDVHDRVGRRRSVAEDDELRRARASLARDELGTVGRERLQAEVVGPVAGDDAADVVVDGLRGDDRAGDRGEDGGVQGRLREVRDRELVPGRAHRVDLAAAVAARVGGGGGRQADGGPRDG